MIELDRHIEILLLSNDCVIVPDLGGFMAHHVDARYDEADGMFVPPIRTLGFNPQLKMNDSLLVQSYIEAYDISYPEALRRIEGEVAELRSHLETTGSYVLNGIGLLQMNDEGKLQFDPCEAGILTPQLYGLGTFELKPLAQESDAPVDDGQAATVPPEKDITIKMAWLRNAVCVAAAIIAFVMMGMPVSNSNKMTEQSAFISVPASRQEVKAAAPASAAEETATIAASEETSADSASESDATVAPSEAEREALDAFEAPSFCIVMASQVSERNAQNYVNLLAEQGFADARVTVSGSKKIRRVVYGSYESEADAATTLQQLRRESRLFKDTWIMEMK